MGTKGQLNFVLTYAVFLSFIIIILALPDSPFIDSIDTPSDVTLNTPTCVFTGTFLDVFAFVICGFQYIIFFISLMSISTTYTLLGALLFTPLIIGLGWTIAVWLRG